MTKNNVNTKFHINLGWYDDDDETIWVKPDCFTIIILHDMNNWLVITLVMLY